MVFRRFQKGENMKTAKMNLVNKDSLNKETIRSMVNVQQIKIIDAARKFLDNHFTGIMSSFFDTRSAVKNKDVEKGLFSFSVSIESNFLPEIFNKDNYAIEMKKELSQLLGDKEIRYFQVSFSVSDFALEGEYAISVCFEVKLA
jgi:predicted thioredoxin/glutaredoxin